MTYSGILPHDLPKQLADDLFVVHGCVKPNAVIRFSRNMTIVRDQGKLTLINPVRMDEVGLLTLEKLGEVDHVLRLGAAHGMDDSYYVNRYDAQFWSFEGGTTYTKPVITHVLVEGGELPFSNAKLFAFKHLAEPEGAILLEGSSGTLLTCDAIQSYSTFPHMPHTNWLARRLLPLMGFIQDTLIPKLWLKHAVKDQAGTQAEFEQLLKLDFDSILSAHGTFVSNGAHAEVKQAFERAFG